MRHAGGRFDVVEIMFARIRREGRPITEKEFDFVVTERDDLEPMPNREGTNPFTGEKVLFSGSGRAIYKDNGEGAGNASLEGGEILTTGIPMAVCVLIANELDAAAEADDRS